MAMIKGSSKPHDTYSIGGGQYHGWAHNLADAKVLGAKIARAETKYGGKWNIMWVTVTIGKGGPVFYKDVGIKMYAPVRGTGRRYESILAELKRRHGVAPFVWTRK